MLKSWWEMKMRILKSLRFYITASVFFGLLTLFFIPWNTTINVPAVFLSQSKVTIFSPTPAYIENSFLERNLRVNKGDVLLALRSPQLEHEIDVTHQEIELLKLQAKRIAASSEDLSNVQVIVQQLQESRSKLIGLEERKDKLTIRAPIEGVVFDLEDSLSNGRWINEELAIATIIQPESPSIEAVVSEFDLPRIDMQATVKFIPDNPQIPPIWGYVSDIEQANLMSLDLTVLASIYGGKVAVEKDKSGLLVPDKSVYRIRINISEVENVTSKQLLRGVVHVEGESESYFSRLYGLVVSVLIRESGF